MEIREAIASRVIEQAEETSDINLGGHDVLVGALTGENQILSLSFIGSVIERVRQCTHWPSKARMSLNILRFWR